MLTSWYWYKNISVQLLQILSAVPSLASSTQHEGWRGYSQSGQQPLNGILQIPQFSSLATHNQDATPLQCRIFTFILRVSNRRNKTLIITPKVACELLLTANFSSSLAVQRYQLTYWAASPSDISNTSYVSMFLSQQKVILCAAWSQKSTTRS